jgi:hypothetical protein
MLISWRPVRWWSRFSCVFATYVLAADLFPLALLLLVNCIGYLPYSDRPGPGWQPAHWPSKDELGFFAGFVVYLAIPTLWYAAAHTVLAAIYELCSLPKSLIRICGAITGFLTAALMMAAGGWIIAISAFGVYVAAGCGLLWGALVLPLLLKKRHKLLPLSVRIILPVLLVGAGIYEVVRPMLPDPGETSATVFVVEKSPEGKPLSELDWSKFGGMPHFDHIPEGTYVPALLSTMEMTDKRKSRVLLILSDGKSGEMKLDVPRTGDAVYYEMNGGWAPLLRARQTASFRVKFLSHESITSDGNCCRSMSTLIAPFDRR